MSYTELQVTSNFTFLQGGSHPEELVAHAAALGYKEIAITDRNSLAGIVRAHVAAKKEGIRLIPACHIDLQDGPALLAYPTDKEAYARLSALLSEGNLRAEKGSCLLYKADVYRYAEGILFIVLPAETLDMEFNLPEAFLAELAEYQRHLGSALYLGATRSYQANDSKKLYRLRQASDLLGIPLVATNNVYYHDRERRELQDILTCIREKCTIYNAGFRLYQNAERHLKPIHEMVRLFRQYPDAIARTKEIAAACQFDLDSLQYVYPEEITSDGRTPQEELVHLVWQGAAEKFKNNLPGHIRTTLNYELEFIERKDYAAYFLTVFDLVRFARGRGILCQGRGSAANSAVCYCLGITSVDPSKFKLLFARFMSDARNEPPDIDVDFEHERREEVIQYIYEKYGRHRAAIVATVTQVHFKGAVRDVAKAMGLSIDAINRLSKSSWEFTEDWHEGQRTTEYGFDAADEHLKKVLDLTRQYIGFPRQLGQHTGGFVITRQRLSDLCPILNARMEHRTCIEWNKDDIEALGFLKVDVLALGMLTCIRKAFDLAEQHYGRHLTLDNIPQDDSGVYDMICRADTIGVFQIESRAQMSMLPRLKPRSFYDLVIEVAIIRPGPIQGNMVHPYLRRRNGEEPVSFPSKELEDILGRTMGVPLFQEQAMEIAIVAAGFTPAEADQLRRSMATFKAKGLVSQFEHKMVSGMTAKGYTEEFARRVFKQLEGFGSYGFPESHAASFALLVYISSWIKCYYPDVFACALLNSLPMGFYQPAQIVIDAQKHGVEVRPADINYSYRDNMMEERGEAWYALRLGLRHIRGLNDTDIKTLVDARCMPYTHITALKDIGISMAGLEKLADADAFRSIGLDRRQALWQLTALGDSPTGIYHGQASETTRENIILPQMPVAEHVAHDYMTMSLSLKAHPLSFSREKLDQLGIITSAQLAHRNNGDWVKVAGLVLVRQRPGTAKGVCFITIEDETGIVNLVAFQKVFEQYRADVLRSKLLMAEGKLQREGDVTHVIIKRCHNLTGLLRNLVAPPDEAVLQPVEANPQGSNQVARRVAGTIATQAEIFPSGRNFR